MGEIGYAHVYIKDQDPEEPTVRELEMFPGDIALCYSGVHTVPDVYRLRQDVVVSQLIHGANFTNEKDITPENTLLYVKDIYAIRGEPIEYSLWGEIVTGRLDVIMMIDETTGDLIAYDTLDNGVVQFPARKPKIGSEKVRPIITSTHGTRDYIVHHGINRVDVSQTRDNESPRAKSPRYLLN